MENMFDLTEIQRVDHAIKRLLPTAIYSFDAESGYWYIGFEDEYNNVKQEVKVNSVYLSNCDDQKLDEVLQNICFDLCAKMANARYE